MSGVPALVSELRWRGWACVAFSPDFECMMRYDRILGKIKTGGIDVIEQFCLQRLV